MEAIILNTKSMFKISYGLYVLTVKNCGFSNGCIINTCAQLTSSPLTICVTLNKTDYSHYMLMQSGEFNVSIIDETAEFSLFKRFGFSSGRWENKLFDFNENTAMGKNKIPYVKNNTCAYISARVIKTIAMHTHTMFIAEVTDCEVLSENPPMTYGFYHKNVKPKVKPAGNSDSKECWVCSVCGYIYEGSLPEDFVCPVCKHGASDFNKIV